VKKPRALAIAAIAIGLLASSAGAVVAQDDPMPADDTMAPSFFTGTFGSGWRRIGEPTSETRSDGVVETTKASSSQWYTNDPRISGLATDVISELEYPEGVLGGSPTEELGIVQSRLTRIENDGGTWVGTLDNIQLVDPAWEISAGWLTGEGDYEGLMAYVATEYENGRKVGGYITADGPPPAPEAFPEQ
jgi:hypothetical protein